MLDDRKKKVLQAIVEEYINTAEPVSSNALTTNHGLDCSSATIRNEMADLEKAGYLDKTHTSSGRVPSEKGYRYYVDELLKDDDISLEEIKYISDKLETKVNEIEDLTKIAANTISEVTHYTTVSIGPKATSQKIEEILGEVEDSVSVDVSSESNNALEMKSDGLYVSSETITGENGKSAYEIWLELGNDGTEQDFIDSLKGADGTTSDITFSIDENGILCATYDDGVEE